MRFRYWLSFLLVLVALLAACRDATPTPMPTLTAAPTATPTSAPMPLPAPDMPEMEIDSVRADPVDASSLVLLREKGSNRYLAIGIGNAQATAIAVKLGEVPLPRPLTHDLLSSVITHLGARLSHVIITDLLVDTFYAKIVLATDGSALEVDARPSDALALALTAKAPIYAEESVLERAGFVLEQEPGEV